MNRTDKAMLIVEILSRKRQPMTAAEIIEASNGELSIGGMYSLLDALERMRMIESEYGVNVLEDGRRMPFRRCRLTTPGADFAGLVPA